MPTCEDDSDYVYRFRLDRNLFSSLALMLNAKYDKSKISSFVTQEYSLTILYFDMESCVTLGNL